jgi:hypothetical protein
MPAKTTCARPVAGLPVGGGRDWEDEGGVPVLELADTDAATDALPLG